MENKSKEPTNIQIFLGVLVFVSGTIVLYIRTFTSPDHEVVMDEFGELHNTDNSFWSPVQKALLIIFPVIGLYYVLKESFRKKIK